MKWMLLTILVAVCVGRVLSINCYTCGSIVTGKTGCGKMFNASAPDVSKSDCGRNSCLKTIFEKGNFQIYSRGCDNISPTVCSAIGNDNCDTRSQGGLSGTACCCNKDLCNAGSPVTAVMVSTLAALILAMVI